MNVKSGGRTIRTTGHRSSVKKAIVTLLKGLKLILLVQIFRINNGS